MELIIPLITAEPYPFSLQEITVAFNFFAISTDPSVLPLSDTIISAFKFNFTISLFAFFMQIAIVSDSFKQGITTDNSIFN